MTPFSVSFTCFASFPVFSLLFPFDRKTTWLGRKSRALTPLDRERARHLERETHEHDIRIAAG